MVKFLTMLKSSTNMTSYLECDITFQFVKEDFLLGVSWIKVKVKVFGFFAKYCYSALAAIER